MSTGRPDRPRLVADIGGTNARLALVSPGSLTPDPLGQFATTDYGDLGELLNHALGQCDGPRPNTVVCAVASPVTGDEIAFTNAGWHFSTAATRRQLGLERLEVINDWVAQGWAIPALSPTDWRVIQSGEADITAPRIALGPGTGLGSALVIPCADGWQVFAAEGGHISVAPTTTREAEIVLTLQSRYGHCSAERMASGVGLEAVHAAICELDGDAGEALTAEAISAAARAGKPAAQETITLFASMLGSATGDILLATGARGGAYLGGGLIPALGDGFDWPTFTARLKDKGRFANYLAAIPVYQITHQAPALLGLARYLAEHP